MYVDYPFFIPQEKDYEEALTLLINLWRTYVSEHGYKDERTLDVRVKIGKRLYSILGAHTALFCP